MAAFSRHPELTEALRELTSVRPAYEEARRVYEGEIDEVFASQKLRDLFGDQGRYFRVNYARTPVDVLLERTMIQGFTVSDSVQRSAIEQAWADNQLGLEAKDVHLRAYEFGDAYLIGWPEDDDPDFPGQVSLYQHDPLSVRVLYDPERPRRKRMAIHCWRVVGSDDNGLPDGVWHRVNLYYPDRVEPWVSSRPLVTATGQTVLQRFDDGYTEYVDPARPDQWPLLNPVDGVIPVFHFRTARPYGRPEHADAYGPQYAINKLLLSLMGAVDHSILPQRYALTDSAIQPSNAADVFPGTADDFFDPERQDTGLDTNSSMETGPGNVWLLSGKNVRVGQFDAARSENFIAPMEALIQQMADVTDLPANRYHRGGQQPSGDSQRMSERPLANKTADRHAQFGVTWHEIMQYICTVNGLGETDAQVAWSPPETYGDLESWRSVELRLRCGIPFDQVMREQGYSSEKIEEWAPYAADVVAALVGGAADTLTVTDIPGGVPSG